MSDKTETNEVALIQVTNGTGCLLLGKRNDNGKWTLPGGHLNQGESPEEGARRELYEETGLTAESLSFLRTVEPTKPGAPRLHCFTAFATGNAHNDHDPDEECDEWEWVDVRGGMPPEIYDKLHGPDGDDNVVRQAFDLKKAESEIDAEHHDTSEVAALLRHPNPVERTMALKLSSVSPNHVTTASQDPDEMVWRTALLHPLAEHATATLAASTRLHDGTPTWSRHDHLLRNQKLGQHHLHAMYSAVMADDTIDQATRHIRLDAIASHPKFAEEQLKKHWGHDFISKYSTFRGPADHIQETTQPHLGHIEEAYHSHINKAEPIDPENADLHDTGWMSPKVIYKLPVAGHEKPQKVMVKPYSEKGEPLSGWAEASSQHLYHAAGIGHLHQKSVTVPHGSGETSAPGTVIHIEEAHPLGSDEAHQAIQKNPDIAQQARRIGLMDFLTSNNDRHLNNFMIRPDGTPLAIDHAASFNYREPHARQGYQNFHDGRAAVGPYFKEWDPTDHHETLKWWSGVQANVRLEFSKRLRLIRDPKKQQELHQAFEDHARWLDNAAKVTSSGGVIPNWRERAGHTPANALAKKMSDAVHKTILSHAESDHPMEGSHIGFLGAHPPSAQEGFDHFEKHVAQSPSEVKPIMGRFAGIEPKAVFKVGADHHFMLKGYHAPSEQSSGWNEMTSQAAYHAAGIGHLHQKVHLTLHGHERAPGVVIHMAPGHITMDQDSAAGDGRLEKILANPEHLESLRRIGLMDNALGNPDRHNSNLMFGPEGEPLAIDQGYSFQQDHAVAKGAVGHENDDISNRGNAAWEISSPRTETWKWWDENKHAILKTVEDHALHIKNPEYRESLLGSVRHRFGLIDKSRQVW